MPVLISAISVLTRVYLILITIWVLSVSVQVTRSVETVLLSSVGVERRSVSQSSGSWSADWTV